jgi:hypothetical protein
MSLITAFLVMISVCVFIVASLACIFKRFRRRAKWIAIVSLMGLILGVVIGSRELDEEARSQGFAGDNDRKQALLAGIADAAAWKATLQKNEADASRVKADAEVAANAKADAAAASVKAKTDARAALLRIPQSQARFITATAQGRTQYDAAQNDFQRGAARPMRAKAICAALSSPQLDGWVGTVTNLSTNGDGDGVLEVNIGEGTKLTTWNNSFSDIQARTLIKSDSSLYQRLSSLKEGGSVRVYATLFSEGPDCFKETSLTLGGSLKEPVFLARFTRIEQINLPD